MRRLYLIILAVVLIIVITSISIIVISINSKSEEVSMDNTEDLIVNEEDLQFKKEYQNYVDKKSPNSPIFKNCFNAFLVGGLICSIGQIIMNICKYRGLSQETSGTIVSIILIAISAFLTGLNIFNKIVTFDPRL